MKPQSVVIINTDPNIAKEILKLLGKNGYRATENYDVVDDTKIIVFTKDSPRTIDECCNQPPGTFAKFVKDNPDPDKLYFK